jgi:glycerophosphoryl diester phosphodiesterase
MRRFRSWTWVLACLLSSACTSSFSPPVVIAHRGASGQRPEHTMAAYELAIALGADFIEPDLVPTQDGILVARHENDISKSTDVAQRPEFASRRATKTIDGVEVTGWFTEDFTLRELQTLRTQERLPELRPANTAFNGLYPVPTLDEVITLAKQRNVGIYPELKHPAYFEGLGLRVVEPLVGALHQAGFRGKKAPVIIQCFEPTTLRKLRTLTEVRLLWLVKDPLSPVALKGVHAFADGIGPHKALMAAPSSLVKDAHRAGLFVHAYTFCDENHCLPPDLKAGVAGHPEADRAMGAAAAEYERAFQLGVDGVFSDHPGTAAAVRSRLFLRPPSKTLTP